MSTFDEMRREKDEFFKHDPYSPLTPEQRREFTGLKYYPENPALRIVTAIEEYPDPQPVSMITSTGDVRAYLKFGQFLFAANGERATLQIYLDPDAGYFFLPFVDAAAGETYEAGRYLEIEQAADGKFLIDFNNAYNPYCAYNEPYDVNPDAVQRWSCPIPPRENHLRVRIEAGEKKNYEGH